LLYYKTENLADKLYLKGGNPMKKFFSSLIFLTTIFFLVVSCSQCKAAAPKYNQISGVVAEVQYIVAGSYFDKANNKITIVRFKNGRIKAFNGISNEIFQEGKINIIFYTIKNTMYITKDTIVSVEIK